MTKQEAAIVSAYTGVMLGDFGELHRYIERILGRTVFSHELANSDVVSEIREKSKADFLAIEVTE